MLFVCNTYKTISYTVYLIGFLSNQLSHAGKYCWGRLGQHFLSLVRVRLGMRFRRSPVQCLLRGGDEGKVEKFPENAFTMPTGHNRRTFTQAQP